jgi:predicted transcriptional regulator
MVNGKELLSDELLCRVQETARIQNREPEEVISEAVNKYLDGQRWQRLVEEGERRAMECGYTEEDVPRLIEEVRAENRARGR